MSTGGMSGERRIVTALFCDVVGSTAMAETMDPEEWGEIVGEALSIMGDAIARHDGTVSEFGGDAVVAFFGAPRAHEDDPYRAVRSALEIRRRIGESASLVAAQLEIRVGIHTGLTVARDFEAGQMSTYSALGDTVNVAARLQAKADPGSIVISGQTRRLLGPQLEASHLGTWQLKGRNATVEAFAVEDLAEPDQRRRGLPGLTSPLVGREAELDQLLGAASAASAGTGRVAVVLGEPGVGKTRLVNEVLTRLAERPEMIWAIGTCVPFDEDLPFHLAAGLVRSLAGLTGGEEPEVVVKGLQGMLEEAGALQHKPAMCHLLGVAPPGETIDADERQAVYASALEGVVQALGRDHRPVVLICEDTHWADPSSVDLFTELLDSFPSLPVLGVLVMRDDRDSSGWSLLEAARRQLGNALVEISLTPLDGTQSRVLISHLLEIESLPENLRKLVLEKADGNPFFLEELVRMLIERGLVVNRDGRWLAKGDLSGLEVPETIQGLLASRVDLLPADVRQAGRAASVLGRRFEARVLSEVFDQEATGSGLNPYFAVLEANGMIRLESIEPELTYEFRHALIHDVMYEGLLHRERRDLHAKAAAVMERLYPEALDELAPTLSRHYAAAGDQDRAVDYLFVAGEQALSKGARVEASRFYQKAYEMLSADTDSPVARRVDAVIGRVSAGMGFIPGPESIALIETVLADARDFDDPDRLARLYERLIWTRSMQGESYADPRYREQLDAGYALIPRLQDEGTAALLHAMMGGAHRSGDEYAESIEPLGRAVAGLAASGKLVEASYNAAMLADSLSQLGRFDEAVEAVDQAAELAEESGDPNAKLDADLIRGSISADRGELGDALEFTRRGIAAAEEHGNTFCNLAGNFKLADQQMRLGQVESAVEHLEKSTGLAQYCNAGGYEALGQAWLAAARSRSGDFRAEDFTRPLNAAVASGSRSAEGLVRMQRAIAFASAGRQADAISDFEKSISLFESYGGLPNLARAHQAYGSALEASGSIEQARVHLLAAEGLFDRLGIIPDERSRQQ